MKCTMMRIAILFAAAALNFSWMSQANAQGSDVTYVGRGGSDANTCFYPTQPCASFSGALGKTSIGGVITCLDEGDFFYLRITKSVAVDCLAGGGGRNTIGIEINAPDGTVRLRNLAVGTSSSNVTAPVINIIAAREVFIENAYIGNARGGAGIVDRRAGPAVLVVRNSSIVGNVGPGIAIAPASGIIGVDLENIASANNRYGLAVGRNGRVMVKNSFFTNNGVAGIEADPGAIIAISNSQITFNSIGVLGSAGANVTLSDSDINSNSTAISGPTSSFGNNRILANSADGTTPTMTSSR